MKALIIFLFIATYSSCIPTKVVYSIKIENNSAVPIRCYLSYKLPDTTLEIEKPTLLNIVRPNETKFTFDNSIPWPNEIEKIPSGKLGIFVINEDTLLKYDWNYIRQNYKILKRFEVTANDLIQNNNTITYQ
jgi:hypothetical protein